MTHPGFSNFPGHTHSGFHLGKTIPVTIGYFSIYLYRHRGDIRKRVIYCRTNDLNSCHFHNASTHFFYAYTSKASLTVVKKKEAITNVLRVHHFCAWWNVWSGKQLGWPLVCKSVFGTVFDPLVASLSELGKRVLETVKGLVETQRKAGPSIGGPGWWW